MQIVLVLGAVAIYAVIALSVDSLRHRFAPAIKAVRRYDRQTTPRRSIRTIAMLLLISPVVTALAVGNHAHATSLSANFLSTTAQVLPTLLLALAVQAGIAFSRTAGPLASRRLPYRAARDYRWFWVIGGGAVPRIPLPKAQTAAFLALIWVFVSLCLGEASALRALATCQLATCAVGKSGVQQIVYAYTAAGALIVALLLVDLVPRIVGLRWEAEQSPPSQSEV